MTSTIVPQRCYRDARAAVTFLERAFGLVPSLVVPAAGSDGIVHAELRRDHAVVMVASVPAPGPWTYRVPAEIGGVNTGSVFLAIPQIDAAYAQAIGAGCTVVSELVATPYGSRDFSVTDLEGFLWHVGTYDPRPAPAADVTLSCGARYVDARAAIAWLCGAFGAREQLVVPGNGDEIAHAQLCFEGDAIFMLGSGRRDDFNYRTPRELDGYTQTLNVFTADPDAHFARARAAGAEILAPLADAPYGARGYTARDCEGQIWNFGTYVPTTVPAAASRAQTVAI
jgi:uncharacterized glyoxalase superfamily protein PhnB